MHEPVSRAAAQDRAVELLNLVGIPNVTQRATAFPHEFSGGMRQRVMIAMAIANRPALIIGQATTALDVTIQAQILDVPQTARRATGAAIVLIPRSRRHCRHRRPRRRDVPAPSSNRVRWMMCSTGRGCRTLGLLGSIPRADVGNREPLTPSKGRLRRWCSCLLAVHSHRAVRWPRMSVPPEASRRCVHSPRRTRHLAACHFADDIERDNRTSRDIFPAVAGADAGARHNGTARPADRVVGRPHPQDLSTDEGAVLRRRVASVTRSTTSASTFVRARRWASWASPGVARPRPSWRS